MFVPEKGKYSKISVWVFPEFDDVTDEVLKF
jgi:hypothetical protein